MFICVFCVSISTCVCVPMQVRIVSITQEKQDIKNFIISFPTATDCERDERETLTGVCLRSFPLKLFSSLAQSESSAYVLGLCTSRPSARHSSRERKLNAFTRRGTQINSSLSRQKQGQPSSILKLFPGGYKLPSSQLHLSSRLPPHPPPPIHSPHSPSP